MADENTLKPEGSTPDDQPPKQIPELGEVEMLSAKVAELESSVAQYKDQLLRKAAEFENYKRRTENDYASIIKFSNEELIVKLLPVLDDFERSLKAGRNQKFNGETEKFREGVELICSKFIKVLEKVGVKPLEVVGKPFDPQLHEALLQVPKKDVPPHTVVEEIDKGYTLNDKVVRHARVIVSTDEPVAAEADERGETNDDDVN